MISVRWRDAEAAVGGGKLVGSDWGDLVLMEAGGWLGQAGLVSSSPIPRDDVDITRA